jgi:hypothetical protein
MCLISSTSNDLVQKLNVIFHFYCLNKYVYFSLFGPIELILTQDITFVAHPTLPVTWFTSIMSYVISITVTSMSNKLQLIWSNRTHSDPSCYFCGTSSTSSNLVHNHDVLCHFLYCYKYVYQVSAYLVQRKSFWPNILLFVAHPTLPVTWFTILISYVISIALSSMSTEFQLIWFNRTHSNPSCYFCGTSSTSSNLVHNHNVLCHFYYCYKYVYQVSAYLVQ